MLFLGRKLVEPGVGAELFDQKLNLPPQPVRLGDVLDAEGLPVDVGHIQMVLSGLLVAASDHTKLAGFPASGPPIGLFFGLHFDRHIQPLALEPIEDLLDMASEDAQDRFHRDDDCQVIVESAGEGSETANETETAD